MQQIELTFDPGLAVRYRDLRECFAACVYAKGLGRVAGKIDVASSNLADMLSGKRNLDTRFIERYMAEFDDATPAVFMAARWLQNHEAVKRQALAEIPELVAKLERLMKEAKA